MSDGEQQSSNVTAQDAAPQSPPHARLVGTSSSPNALESSPAAARARAATHGNLPGPESTPVPSQLCARSSDNELLSRSRVQTEARSSADSGEGAARATGWRPAGPTTRSGALAMSDVSAGEEAAAARVLSSLAGVKQAIYGRPVGYVAGVDPIAMPSVSAATRMASRSTSDMSALAASGSGATSRGTPAGSGLRTGASRTAAAGAASSWQWKHAATDAQKPGAGRLPTYISKWDPKLNATRPSNVSYGTPSRAAFSTAAISATAPSTPSAAATSTTATFDAASGARMAASATLAPVSSQMATSLTSNLSSASTTGSTTHLYKKNQVTSRPTTLESEKQAGARGGLGAERLSPATSPDSPKPVVASSSTKSSNPPTTASGGAAGSTGALLPVGAAKEGTAAAAAAARTQAQEAEEREPSAPPKAAVTPAIKLPAGPYRKSTPTPPQAAVAAAAFPNANANEARAASCSAAANNNTNTNTNTGGSSRSSCVTSCTSNTGAAAREGAVHTNASASGCVPQTLAAEAKAKAKSSQIIDTDSAIGAVTTTRPQTSGAPIRPASVSSTAAGAGANSMIGGDFGADATLSVRASDRGKTAGRSRQAPVEKAKQRAKLISKEKETAPAAGAANTQQSGSTSASASASTTASASAFKSPAAIAKQRQTTNPTGYLTWWRFLGGGVTRTSSVKEVRTDAAPAPAPAPAHAEARAAGVDAADGVGADSADRAGGDAKDDEERASVELERRLLDRAGPLLQSATARSPSTSSLGRRLSSSLSDLAAAATATTTTSSSQGALYTKAGARPDGPSGGARAQLKGASGAAVKPGFGHPKTAQLSTEQRRELVLMQMKRVDAQLAASVRQKQMLLEALRRRTQSRPEHTGSAPTQRSSENPSASTSAAPLVVAPSASASAVDIFRIAGGQKTSLSSLSTTTSAAAAAAPLERSNVLRLADHLLQQLRAVVRVSQQRLLLLNAPHKSQYAAVQTAAEIVDQINAQLREFNNLLRGGECPAPVEIVAKAKSLLEADLNAQRAASRYLPRRPSSRELISSQLVFNFGGGGGSDGVAAAAGKRSTSSSLGATSCCASTQPSPATSPVTSRADEAAASRPTAHPNAGPSQATGVAAAPTTGKSLRAASLSSSLADADDADNTDYDDVPDEPVPPASKARKRLSCELPDAHFDQKRPESSTSSSSRSIASTAAVAAATTTAAEVTVASLSTIITSDATNSVGQGASPQANAVTTCAAERCRQSADSLNSCPPPPKSPSLSSSQSQPQQALNQAAGKTSSESSVTGAGAGAGGSAAAASAQATGKRSVIVKLTNAALLNRVGQTRIRLHTPFNVHRDWQSSSSNNNNRTSSITTIKSGAAAAKNAGQSAGGPASSAASGAAHRAAASALRGCPEPALKDLHV